MNCLLCGEVVEKHPVHGFWVHKDGRPCRDLPVTLGQETFTRAELRALRRVARAQIEMDRLRAGR